MAGVFQVVQETGIAPSVGRHTRVHNGIPLVATLDALFDAGLISFTDDGQIVISESVTNTERHILNLNGAALVRRPTAQSILYLHHHRAKVFLDAWHCHGQ
jgi:predicted restriction endonuclease